MHFRPLLAVEVNGTVLIVLGIILAAGSLAVLRKSPSMYWIGVLALHIQSVFFVFQFDKVVEVTREFHPDVALAAPADPSQRPLGGEEKVEGTGPSPVWTGVQMIALGSALFPFGLPLVAAALTGHFVGNPYATIGAFTFWSLIQTLILGHLTGQNKVLEELRPLVRSAVPVLSAIVSLTRTFGHGSSPFDLVLTRPSDLA